MIPSTAAMAHTPPGWVETTLGAVADVRAGGTPSRKVPEFWGGDIPWVTTGQVDFCRIVEGAEGITERGLAESAAALVPAETILMAMYGQGKTRGKVAMLGVAAATNQACAAISGHSEVDQLFLYFFLASRYRQIRALSNAGSQENLSGGLVRSIPVILPPLQEQRAIAEVLADFADAPLALDLLISKKRALATGAARALLSGAIRLAGAHREWEPVALGGLGRFLKGQGLTKADLVDAGLPCIRYGEIYTTHHRWIRSLTSRIAPATAATSTRLNPGDLLFTGSGETAAEIGKCVAFLDDYEAYAGGDVIILRDHGQDARFMGYALNAPDVCRQRERLGQGDAVVHISARALGQITLTLPDLEEQRAIAAVLSDMDLDVDALVARRNKLHDVRRCVANELLTGTVRLS